MVREDCEVIGRSSRWVTAAGLNPVERKSLGGSIPSPSALEKIRMVRSLFRKQVRPQGRAGSNPVFSAKESTRIGKEPAWNAGARPRVGGSSPLLSADLSLQLVTKVIMVLG